MSTITIKELEDHITDLPTLPSVLASLMPLEPEDDDHFEQVTAVAENDPCLSLRILQTVSKLKRSSATDVATLPQALSVIGSGGLKALLREHSGARVFMPTSDAEKRLWLHSLQTAVMARELAKFFPHLGVRPDEAYLGGLLHDAGRMIRFQYIDDDPDHLEQAGFTTPDELLEAEKLVTGFTHTELAAVGGRKWHLSDRFRAVLELHHSPPRELARRGISCKSCEPKHCLKLIELIQIADEASVVVLQGNPLDDARFTGVVGQHIKTKSHFLHDARLSAQKFFKLRQIMIDESNQRYRKLQLGRTDFHRRLEALN